MHPSRASQHLTAWLGARRSAAGAYAQPWSTTAYPNILSPTLVVHMHFNITKADWDTIQADTTFDIYKPAMMWGELMGESEAPILVALRRKSASPICEAAGKSCKISFKVAVDDYKDVAETKCMGIAPAECADMPEPFKGDLQSSSLKAT